MNFLSSDPFMSDQQEWLSLTSTPPDCYSYTERSDSSSFGRNAYEESLGLDDVGQNCDDALDNNFTEPTVITTATFTILTNVVPTPTVDNENPLQTTTSSNKKRKRSTKQTQANYQIQKRLTTYDISTNSYTINAIYLLNPLPRKIDMRTTHNFDFKDCFGDNVTFIVYGNLPDDIEAEVAMLSKYLEEKFYYSLYRIRYPESQNKDYINKLRCKAKLEKVGNGVYIIRLDHLFVRKQKISTREKNTEEGKKYELMCYPSGDTKPVRAKHPKTFVERHNLNQPRLAIQFFPSNSNTPIKINGMQNQFAFLSNPYVEDKAVNKRVASRYDEFKIKFISPVAQFVSFNDNNQCIMEINIDVEGEFPKIFDAHPKWLEISLMKEQSIDIYYIDDNGARKSSVFEKITQVPFKINLSIVKKTLAELQEILPIIYPISPPDINNITWVPDISGVNSIIEAMCLNRFNVQFRLLPGITMNDTEYPRNYSDAPILQTHKFIESFKDSNSTGVHQIETTFNAMEQNLPIITDSNQPSNNRSGLPVVRATTTTTEYNNYE